MIVDIKKEIHKIFEKYIEIKSYTNTSNERLVENYLQEWFGSQTYFMDHPEYWGLEPLEDDPLHRHVIWGMVKGTGERTIVLIHHYDVVEIEEYESIKKHAHNIKEINEWIRELIHKFDQEAINDLNSRNWQFGRGSADMKAGGAIELALLKQYSLEPDFKGNVIVCCVPDEENVSAGMCSAVTLLSRIKQKFNLNFLLMINTEPHERFQEDTGVIYEGSVGKIMPIIYARGTLAHVGRIFEGLNPLHLISELVIKTELNMSFSNFDHGERTPPPSWLYVKDRKVHYDASIPKTVCASLTAQTINTKPEHFFEHFKSVAHDSFQTVIDRMNKSYYQYLEATGRSKKNLPWKVNIKMFSDLVTEAFDTAGKRFKTAYDKKIAEIYEQVKLGNCSLMESGFEIIEFCLQFIKDESPLLVIGISPPYYPDVANHRLTNLNEKVANLGHVINQYSMENWEQPYSTLKYFTGICDLTYANITISEEDIDKVSKNIPLWGKAWHFPFDKIRDIQMPCINIGPWGKNYHKITERVLKEDLYERTPKLVDFTIKYILSS